MRDPLPLMEQARGIITLHHGGNEILVRIQQTRKGKGKGKGKKGTCWKCVEGDHYSRDCPNDKQDSSWTAGRTGKNRKGSKAGKDAGRGWEEWLEQLEKQQM